MNDILYFEPKLTRSTFEYRIKLAEKRLESYPLDDLDFVMIDLERPAGRIRHAHQCTTDLTGRTIEFLAQSHLILDGQDDSRIDALFHRMMLKGMFTGFTRRYFPYFDYSNDPECFDAVKGEIDRWIKLYEEKGEEEIRHYVNTCCCYVEPLAKMYTLTGDERLIRLASIMAEVSLSPFEGAHSHGLLTVLRSMLSMTLASGDMSFAERVAEYREKILPEQYADGSVSEGFPRSRRTEGCSIADWIILNLRWFEVYGDESALDAAEHSLLNGLFFNQFITGGFGHRNYMPRGYSTGIEEAWWCCTQTGGLALCEFARHAVALDREKKKITVYFPIPGVYTLNDGGRVITVKLTSLYPADYNIHAEIIGGDGYDFSFRKPYYIRGAKITGHSFGNVRSVNLDCRIGHYSEKRDGGYVMKYGPLMLAPLIYEWKEDESAKFDEGGVPDGYIPQSIGRGRCAIIPGERDGDGFYNVAAGLNLPEWPAFDDGVGSRTGTLNRAAANVRVRDESGRERVLCFHPMAYQTSNLTLCDVQTVFGLIENDE